MGDGSRISFWWDSWLPTGPLIEQFSESVITGAGLNLYTSVREFLSSPIWCEDKNIQPSRRRNAILDRLKALIPTNMTLKSDKQDHYFWLPCSNGIFSISSAYKSLCDPRPKVPWYDLIWFPRAIPRFAFILWLVVFDRIPTNDRMFRFGVCPTSSCCLCQSRRETLDYLFFLCPFSRGVWDNTMARLVPSNFPRTWSAIFNLITSHARLPFR